MTGWGSTGERGLVHVGQEQAEKMSSVAWMQKEVTAEVRQWPPCDKERNKLLRGKLLPFTQSEKL